jgi:hypothetical protein
MLAMIFTVPPQRGVTPLPLAVNDLLANAVDGVVPPDAVDPPAA